MKTRVKHKKTEVISAEKKGSLAVRAISGPTRRSDTSRQLEPINEFANALIPAGKTFLIPEYDPLTVDRIYRESNILPQCVEAKVTNVAKYGWEIVQASKDTEIDENERLELQSFIDRANSDESLTTIHSSIVHDYEEYGYAFLEVIRDRSGKVSILRHAKSSITRLIPKNDEKVAITYDVARGNRVSNITELKKFRTYVQIVANQIVYFKEFGDPRRLDCTTGDFESSDHPVANENLATELLHFRQKSEDPYGVPRWINQLPSMLGSREAEEVNYRYFQDNTVPPMMLTVAGGRLTTNSYDELTKLLNEGIGKDRQNRILLVEAVPASTGLDDTGNVQLKVEKLTDARQSDGLFKEYDDSNQSKVMSSFRIGPIVVGKSQDHDFATANTAQFIAETQVFSPDRSTFDEVYNNKLVNSPYGLNLKTVMLRSKAPSITNPETLVKSLTAANVMGAVTPRSSIAALNTILQINLPQYPEVGAEGYDKWMDQPIQMALVVKKQEQQQVQSPENKAVSHPNDGNVGMRMPENGQQ